MPRKWPAIEHVAATLRPCVDGMSGWEKVSDLSMSFGSSVVDLTGSSYGRLEEQRRDRAAQLDAWAQSLGEAPTGQPVELSTMTTNPTRALALQQWEKEYGR